MAASMKLGSKPDVFHLDGDSWFCSTGLTSDMIVEVGKTAFHLHKFPLLSRSRMLESLIGETCSEGDRNCVIELHDVPGGAKAFLLVAKFCYGVKIDLTAQNIVSLRCAAEYLQMFEECGDGNLITQTEIFLNEVLSNWRDSLKALESCEEVMSHAEELHIVSRCINSLAMKACADPGLFSWPMSAGASNVQSPEGMVFWNGIRTTAKPHPVGEDWWYDDVSFLPLLLFKRLILAVVSNGMKPDRVAGGIMCYATTHLPLLGRQSGTQIGDYSTYGANFNFTADADQRFLLEELVDLLPNHKGVAPANFLLRLLRTAMILHANPSCRDTLERCIGAQLDQASLEDLLIPNMGYSSETLYDIDCIQRILDHFVDRDDNSSNCIMEDGQLVGGSDSLTPMTSVANLIDGYLAEVAPDINLKLTKFQTLAALIPDYSRPLDDGIYRAVDIYLKAHPWLTDSEREQLCRLMNCQKLSLEASTHAAQNERLPLRVIVQILFFEQLRLRTSVNGWFFVSDNLDRSGNQHGNPATTRNTQGEGTANGIHDMRERVSELEKECMTMREEMEKLVKTKKTWNAMFRKIGFAKLKPRPPPAPREPEAPKPSKESPESSAPILGRKGAHRSKSGEL